MPAVKFYASLRKVTGEKQVEVPARNVKELLARLSEMYKGELDRYLKMSSVLINGKNVVHMKGRRTRLKEDDVVSIFPPLGGG